MGRRARITSPLLQALYEKVEKMKVLEQDTGQKNITTAVAYPMWAWEGTLYEEFADACAVGNHIPRRFFVESVKTVVGAICGHRLQLPEDSSMESRFYTILLTDKGGTGKSTVRNWTRRLFDGTGLMRNNNNEPVGGLPMGHIGCWFGGFGSGTGMLKRFAKNERVLQVYDEVSVIVEKIGIQGSGASLLGNINELYEGTIPPSNETKESGEMNLPTECRNSILGCGIKSKWDEAFGSTSVDNSGFFQRLNIVYGEDIKTVAMLHEPNLQDIGHRLVKKIRPLESRPLRVKMNPDALAFLNAWYERFKEETIDEPADVNGRINCIVLRNALQIAWLLDTQDPETATSVTITQDVMMRATALGDYQYLTRRVVRPLAGKNDTAKLEGIIERHLKKHSPQTRSELYKSTNAQRYGLDLFNRALDNTEKEGLVRVEREQAVKTTHKGGGRKKDVIHWDGSA